MYDQFQLVAKLSFRSRVTFEEDASCLVSTRRSLSAIDPVIASSSAPRAMAQKTLRDYSAPSPSQVPTRPEVNTGGENFEIKTGLITMVQASLLEAKIGNNQGRPI